MAYLKSVFGFLAGAVIGAGGLLGLRKALELIDKTDGPETTARTSIPSSRVEPSPSKTEKVASFTGKNEDAAPVTKPVPEASQTASKQSDGTTSLVGEPAARHKESKAVTQTDPEAATPRSETAEPAVPDKLEVKVVANTVTTQEKAATEAPESSPPKTSKPTAKARPDDFTVIIDIGPVFNQKLHDAGIKSFKAFAKLTPAQIEEKTGIPAERIEYGQWLEQVQKLVAGEEKA